MAVRAQFNEYSVAGKHADVMQAQPPREMPKHHFILQCAFAHPHSERERRERLFDNSLQRHGTALIPYWHSMKHSAEG